MEHKISKTIMSGIFLFIPLISYAQNKYLPDMHEAEHRFVASGSYNPAFLTQFPIERTSYLQAFGNIGSGDFIDYNQSSSTRGYGIKTESYYRFNDRMMLYGMMSYGNSRGEDMSGSAFIPTTFLPFDLVETTDTCAGDKELEIYSLSGALGYRLTSALTIGGKVYYQSSNYAKFKDLRHQNSKMQLQVNAGAAYDINQLFTVGLSYQYHRSNESLSFGVYGNTDRQYHTLIDLGGFFGRNEVFSDMGVGYTSESTPLFTETHGGALQLQINPGRNIRWFNEFVYNAGDGQFGSGDDLDVTYSTHDVTYMGYRGKMQIKHGSDAHVIELAAGNASTKNYENNYKMTTDKDGISHIQYYGSNQVLDRDNIEAALKYTFFKDADKTVSTYYLGAVAHFSNMESTTTLYPFYRKQEINTWDASLFGAYRWFVKNQVFTLSADLSYGAGGGTMNNDGVYASVSDGQKSPDTRNDLLQKHYDYLTAQRLGGSIKLAYERNILKNISAYAIAGVSPRYALDSTLKQEHYLQFDLQLGVKF